MQLEQQKEFSGKQNMSSQTMVKAITQSETRIVNDQRWLGPQFRLSKR